MPDTLPMEFQYDGYVVKIEVVEMPNGRWNWEFWIGDAAKVSPGGDTGCISRNAAILEATAEAEWRVKGMTSLT